MPKLFVSAVIHLGNAKFYSCHINLVTVLQSTCTFYLNTIKLFPLTYFNRILFPYEFSCIFMDRHLDLSVEM